MRTPLDELRLLLCNLLTSYLGLLLFYGIPMSQYTKPIFQQQKHLIYIEKIYKINLAIYYLIDGNFIVFLINTLIKY